MDPNETYPARLYYVTRHRALPESDAEVSALWAQQAPEDRRRWLGVAEQVGRLLADFEAAGSRQRQRARRLAVLDAAGDVVPRVLATWVPQAWQRDHAVEADGRREFDVTLEVFGLLNVNVPRVLEDRKQQNAVLVQSFPEVKAHGDAPYQVYTEESVRAAIERIEADSGIVLDSDEVLRGGIQWVKVPTVESWRELQAYFLARVAEGAGLTQDRFLDGTEQECLRLLESPTGFNGVLDSFAEQLAAKAARDAARARQEQASAWLDAAGESVPRVVAIWCCVDKSSSTAIATAEIDVTLKAFSLQAADLRSLVEERWGPNVELVKDRPEVMAHEGRHLHQVFVARAFINAMAKIEAAGGPRLPSGPWYPSPAAWKRVQAHVLAQLAQAAGVAPGEFCGDANAYLGDMEDRFAQLLISGRADFDGALDLIAQHARPDERSRPRERG